MFDLIMNWKKNWARNAKQKFLLSDKNDEFLWNKAVHRNSKNVTFLKCAIFSEIHRFLRFYFLWRNLFNTKNFYKLNLIEISFNFSDTNLGRKSGKSKVVCNFEKTRKNLQESVLFLFCVWFDCFVFSVFFIVLCVGLEALPITSKNLSLKLTSGHKTPLPIFFLPQNFLKSGQNWKYKESNQDGTC